ncbi:zinc finger MYM-type protein 5-like [Solenopsis invicta]|uniref:zinc finger MYM-type protein 5-like n=1 Tax=Solenopsis invicta TaxID=13686 RepID=UPI000E33F500|nr:zinc finger MYM-type protein 5-like [Solenopsis invicta]
MSKKPSGAEYRKRKADRDREEQKQVGSFLKYLRPEQESISSYANEIDNEETDDVRITMTEIEQPEHNEDLTETIIKSTETEMPVINKTSENHHENYLDCQVAVQKNELKVSSLNDISTWSIPLEATLITELVMKDPIQNKEGSFAVMTRRGAETKGEIRTMSSAWFYRQLDNGEKVLRTWMVYSTVNKSLYCFCCRLFTSKDLKHTQSTFAKNGFRQWWKLNPKVKQHENSSIHVASFGKKWK